MTRSPLPRLEQAAIAAALRKAGASVMEIAETLGISRSYASDLCNDPSGERGKARKRSYAGVCVDCGGATNGSDGPGKASTRCQPCEHAREHAARVWTPETILDAIGPTPMLTNDVFRIVQRSTVLREFGSWAECRRQLGWPQAYRGRGVRGGTRCGTLSGYQWGCHCAECRHAYNEYNEYRRRRTQLKGTQ